MNQNHIRLGGEQMDLYEALMGRHTSLSVIGLGYVGLPLAIAFAKHLSVIGYDANAQKIALYKDGIDPTREVGNDAVKRSGISFISSPEKLATAKFHIVAVPTPVNVNNMPDLEPLKSASHTLGKYLSKGSTVVYESTVYPGVTEEICVPILETESGLKCGADFKVGYSPERINPGDKVHRLESIVKVVAGMDEESLDMIAKVYSLVAKAGVYRASSIKVAEAAKVIENSQRDINIAFMNELAMIFHRMGIDTQEVLSAARTKWNFLDFRPGLVGGHCIGVDPYYLTYKAESLGYHSQVILSGRRINDSMGKYVAEHLVKHLIRQDIPVKGAKIAILGLTFKENCPDTRNTKVMDIYKELSSYGISLMVVDPVADAEEAKRLYDITLHSVEEVTDMDAVIVAVSHDVFREYRPERFASFYRKKAGVLLDLKGIFDRVTFRERGFDYWRL